MGEYRNTPGVPPPTTASTRRSYRSRVILSAILVLTAIAAAGHWIRIDRFAPATGYVSTSDYAEVRSPVPGRVRTIVARTGDRISAGDPLVHLEDDTERSEWNAALRQMEKAEAELALRSAEWRERKRTHGQQLEITRRQWEHARERLSLTQRLAEQGLASGRDLSDETLRLHNAESHYNLLAETDFAVEELALNVLRRELEARRDAAQRAQALLESRTLRAPIDGTLLRYTFYPGEVVRTEQVLYEVFGGGEWVLKLRVPERFAARIRVDQHCESRISTHSGFNAPWFHGSVTGLRDVIQTDSRQATYRMVYVTLDPSTRIIHPGSTANAHIRYGRGSIWQILFNN